MKASPAGTGWENQPPTTRSHSAKPPASQNARSIAKSQQATTVENLMRSRV
jgi:hypothetical protein